MRPRRGAAVPRIESLSHVGVFTRNRERAEAFYTRKVGLVVRGRPAGAGLPALGAARAGAGGGGVAAAARQIGTVTGVGFTTTNLDATVRRMRAKGVRVEVLGEEGGERDAGVFDADRDSLFLSEAARAKARRAGLSRMDFVTI